LSYPKPTLGALNRVVWSKQQGARCWARQLIIQKAFTKEFDGGVGVP
jgi:hypothetical protein